MGESPADLKRLMLGLLGDPVRARIAKEAAFILKTASKVARQVQAGPSRPRPVTPYVRGSCYNCDRWAISPVLAEPHKRLLRLAGAGVPRTAEDAGTLAS